MRSRGALLRAAGLISGAALTLHQLRYAIGYGLGWDEASSGHGYLPLAAVLSIGLLMLATLQFLALVTRGQRRSTRAPRFRTAWLATSAVLLAIFVGQELLEGLLAGGEGLQGLLAHAGWSAVPLALALGALVALALRGAERVLGSPGDGARPARRVVEPRRPLPRFAPPRESVLSRHLASRAPPLAS